MIGSPMARIDDYDRASDPGMAQPFELFTQRPRRSRPLDPETGQRGVTGGAEDPVFGHPILLLETANRGVRVDAKDAVLAARVETDRVELVLELRDVVSSH